MRTTDTVGTDVSCEAFRPITWSKRDTQETVADVKTHNAVFGALCGWGEKNGKIASITKVN